MSRQPSTFSITKDGSEQPQCQRLLQKVAARIWQCGGFDTVSQKEQVVRTVKEMDMDDIYHLLEIEYQDHKCFVSRTVWKAADVAQLEINDYDDE